MRSTSANEDPDVSCPFEGNLHSPAAGGACCGITVEAVKAEDGSMTPEALRKAVGRCSQSSDMQQ